jgi:PAS domain S-box-containing protein
MHWVVPIWSMLVSVSLILATISGLVWLFDRKNVSNLLFAIIAASVAVMAVTELGMMYAGSPAEYARWVRSCHVPIFCIIVGMVLFIRVHFGTGRAWLAWTIILIRCVVLAGNFLVHPNFNWQEISSLQRIEFLGEEVTVIGHAVVRSWQWLPTTSVLLYAGFVFDASLASWRRGGPEEKRRALVVGGGLMSFVIISMLLSQLVVWGIVHLPVLITPAFVLLMAAMGFELCRDVLRANRMAAELRDASETMNLASGIAQLALWRWDVVKDSVWVSPLGRRFFGLNETEPFNFQRFLEILHPEDREPVRDHVKAALQGGGAFNSHYRIIRPDGTTHWIEALGKVEFDSARRPTRMLGVSADVTQRRQLEGHFRLAVEASPNGMVLTNAQGRIILANARAATKFGYEPAELPGQPLEILLPDRFRDGPLGLRAALHAPATHRSVGMGTELFARRKDGGEFPVEITLNPVESAEGTLVLAVIVDISARRDAEMETRRLRDELAHFSRVTTLSELSGSLAHELNQPLAIILSNAQAAQRLLARNPPDLAEVRDIITDIINADRRAGEVIIRLRALLKHSEPEWKPLSVPAIIDEVLVLMRSDLIARGISVVRPSGPSVPDISGDLVTLQQVFLNLFTNACDAMAKNRPGDRVLTIETRLEGLQVLVRVSDLGCGLPAEAARIFEPFFTTKAHGLGMGLPLCRTIVTTHGGRLWAAPNPDRGSTFFLELPALNPAS